MPAPITSSVYQADFFNDLFRQRWGANTVNDGDVRDVLGFKIDVTGTVARGERITRSVVTPGPGSTTYDPATRPHTPPDSSLPSSSLIALQGGALDRSQIEEAMNRPPSDLAENPYAVSLPAYVDVIQSEAGRIDSVTSVGYSAIDGPFSRQAEMDFTRGQIDRLQALAKIERDLSHEYGEPVKLAWDGVAQEYLMLRPGQDGYDRVTSVNDMVAHLPRDLKGMGYSEGMIRDVMA